MTRKEPFKKLQAKHIPHNEDMISELKYSFYLISCIYFLGWFLIYLIISGILSDFTWILHSSFFRWTFTLYIFHLFCLICDALLTRVRDKKRLEKVGNLVKNSYLYR